LATAIVMGREATIASVLVASLALVAITLALSSGLRPELSLSSAGFYLWAALPHRVHSVNKSTRTMTAMSRFG
jgi:hypothetical protein